MRRLAVVLALLIASGCGGDSSPTEPEDHPLIGTWVGGFYGSTEGDWISKPWTTWTLTVESVDPWRASLDWDGHPRTSTGSASSPHVLIWAGDWEVSAILDGDQLEGIARNVRHVVVARQWVLLERR